MGAPAYITENHLSSSVTLTVSSEDPIYPKENLYLKDMAQPFYTTSTTLLEVEMNFGSSINADTMVVFNHNASSAGTFKIFSDNSPSPTTLLVTGTYRQHDMYMTFTDPNHQYFKLQITDPGTSGENLRVGEIYLYSQTLLTAHMAYGFVTKNRHQAVSMETIRGKKYVYSLFDRRIYEAVFISIQDNHVEELKTLDGLVVGAKWPFVWIPNTSDPDVYLVRKEQEFVINSVRFNEWNVTMTLEEESRGSEVGL